VDCFISCWDAAKCVIEVFIDNVADYPQFRTRAISGRSHLSSWKLSDTANDRKGKMPDSRVEHAVERHGIGRAPYQLFGCQPCKPIAKCEFCARQTAIDLSVKVPMIEPFGVGCDCVEPD
jgi:hypothetical protein